jgi:hypothetical protein
LFPAQRFAERLSHTFELVRTVDKDRIVRLFRRLVGSVCDEESQKYIIAIFLELGPCIYRYQADLDCEQREDVWSIPYWFAERGLCLDIVQEFVELDAEICLEGPADPAQNGPDMQDELDALAVEYVMAVMQKVLDADEDHLA